MMGHREKLVSGDEWDAAHQYSRGILFWQRGQLKHIKRRMNKRARREAKVNAAARANVGLKP